MEKEENLEKAGGSRLRISRSPSHPNTSLPKAIKRIEALHKKAQHHKVGIKVLAESWGYSEKSSGSRQTLATLTQFGLLKREGTGGGQRFLLTDDALRIVRDADPDSAKRKQAIARVALKPKVYKELWERYGADVGDAVLQNYLILDRREEGESSFNQTSASKVISTYKETIAYVQREGDIESISAGENSEEVDQSEDGESGTKKMHAVPTSLPSHQRLPSGSSLALQQGEQELWTEMGVKPQQRLRLLITGELDDYLLEALEDFAKRQRKRLRLVKGSEKMPSVDDQPDDDSDEEAESN